MLSCFCLCSFRFSLLVTASRSQASVQFTCRAAETFLVMFSRQDTILRGKGDNYQNWSMLIGASRNLVLDHTTVFLKIPVFVSTKTEQSIFDHSRIFLLFLPVHTDSLFKRFRLSSTLIRYLNVLPIVHTKTLEKLMETHPHWKRSVFLTIRFQKLSL